MQSTRHSVATLTMVLGFAIGGCAAPGDVEIVSDVDRLDSTASLDDLMSLASGRTHSSVTPMGVYFKEAAAHVLTASERTFLADAAQSPPIPPSTSGLHLAPFAVELYPSSSGVPTPTDVRQHAIGDCSAAAILASLAFLAPRFVQSLIADNHDGTFSVRVFDPSGRPLVVNVDSRFLADSTNELAAASGKSGQADWATVLEKTVMKYLAVFHIVPRIGGIGSEFVSPIFTGNGDSFAFSPGSLSPSQMTRAARAALASGKLVIGGFNAVMPLENAKTVTMHAYTILVPATPSTLLSMRNPWGKSPGVNGGFDLSQDGVLNVPSTAAWARAIDLRIIEPGVAAAGGATAPYTPAP